jgi:hypothetical protein
MINYNKTIHNKKDFPYPYMMCKEWTITANGIIINSDDNKLREEIILTPSWIDLTLWKAAYYDRGKRFRFKH